jgi:hypothetical protein
MGKIGYNINLGGLGKQFEEAQANAKSASAAFHLLMTAPSNGINTQGDAEAIDRWIEKIQPAQIVWRTYSKLEGNWSVFPSNDEIIKRWRAENRPQYIRDDPSNEPSLFGKDPRTNALYVKSRADLLRKAADIGIKVAVGAFSVGTPHESLIANGTYDELIRAVVEGGHYFSVHEYCPGIPGAGDVFSYEKLLNPDEVMETMKRDPWPVKAVYWLLRRSDRFVVRAREIGLSDPQIIVTESYIDLIPDANDVINQLRDKYGIPAYNKDLRGVLAWRMYYADAFPDKSFSDVITQLSKYIEENIYYPDHIKGVCLFSFNWDWDTPEAHNYLNPYLDDFRRVGLPNLSKSPSLFTEPEEKRSDTDTISTRSPEFWERLRQLQETSDTKPDNKYTNEIETLIDLADESTAEIVSVGSQESSDEIAAHNEENTKQMMPVGVREPSSSATLSNTIEMSTLELGSESRWQSGVFESEGVRVRVAPFTDAEPIALLSDSTTGQQHVGEIQSDGYTWRWIRYMNNDKMMEGYAASAFYKFMLG